MSKSVEIDGSIGEGGGQVLRTSLALSLLTGRPFHMRRIRAGRAKPGLQAQHLASVEAAAKVGNATVRGAKLQSVELAFDPGPVKSGDYHFKIGTAGATSLVLHTVYLPLALTGSDSEVTIEGGTHVTASPCFDFLARSWSHYLRTLALPIDLTLHRTGFYPRGGGMIHARITGVSGVQPFAGLDIKELNAVKIVVGTTSLPAHVADRLIEQATARMDQLGLSTNVETLTWQGGPGCMMGIELPTSPAPTFFFALGERGKPAEAVGNDAADQVAAYLASESYGVDEHSADQLLLPLAVAKGTSQFRVAVVSSHLLTNAAVIQRFLDREISIAGTEGEPGAVTIR